MPHHPPHRAPRAAVPASPRKIPIPRFDAVRKAITPNNTLCIFDWDDTLFPTAWLCVTKVALESPNALLKHTRNILRPVREAAAKVLSAAKAFGSVVIVTNAERGWVEASAKTFLPELYPLLDGVEIVSARADWSGTYPRDPFKWKKHAFKEVIRAKLESPGGLYNALSFGDSAYERSALLKSCKAGRVEYAKTIKLASRPSVTLLAQQLRVLVGNLCNICMAERDLDLMMAGEESRPTSASSDRSDRSARSDRSDRSSASSGSLPRL